MSYKEFSRDRRSYSERRRRTDRRSQPGLQGGYRYPPWAEQRIQFITHYVFLVLGILFFNVVDGIRPAYWSPLQLNVTVYLLSHTLLFAHARKYHIDRGRYQLAMWIDIVITDVTARFGGDEFIMPLERVDRAMYHSKLKQSGGGLAVATCAGVTAGF
jgi:hypothetical protein